MSSRALCAALRLAMLAAGALLAHDAIAASSGATMAVSATVANSCSFSTTNARALDVRCSSGALGSVTLSTTAAAMAAAPTGFVPVALHNRSADESAHGSCAFVLIGHGLATAATTAPAQCIPAQVSAPRHPGADSATQASIVF